MLSLSSGGGIVSSRTVARKISIIPPSLYLSIKAEVSFIPIAVGLAAFLFFFFTGGGFTIRASASSRSSPRLSSALLSAIRVVAEASYSGVGGLTSALRVSHYLSSLSILAFLGFYARSSSFLYILGLILGGSLDPL